MKLNYKDTSAARVPGHVMDGGTLRIEGVYAPAGNHSAKKAFLSVIRSRADIGVHAFLSERTVIGRSPTCTFPLHDMKVSGHHATITRIGDGGFIIEDLNSTNGTRVDAVPVVGQKVLKDGDKIFVGETVVRFALADELDIDYHSEVATLVGTDPLTDLPSKRRFDEALEFAFQNSLRGEMPLSVLMMDMDGVKQINDTHGHLYGAHVIGETGRLIAKVLGNNGRACRFGGDEFSAFLPGQNLASACTVAEQIRTAVESAGMEKDGIPLRPTISIGVSSHTPAFASSLALITSADDALYRAKASGKNCVAL